MDKFKNLAAFVNVVEASGFAAAARRLGRTRSSVNKSVMALEDELGVQLLNRTTRRVSATANGEAYYTRAKSILQDIAEADRAISENDDEPRGILRLNAPLSFGALHLSKALSDFLAQYPELRLELALTDHFVDPLEGGFDAVVRIGVLNENPSLIDHPIVEMHRYLVASPEFLERHGDITSVNQLKSLPCLHYGSLGEGHVWRLVGKGQELNVPVNGVMCANNGEALQQAALCGLGVTMLPTFIVGPALQTGALVRVLPDYAPPPIHLMLLYPPSRHLSPKIRQLVSFLYERFGEHPSWDLLN